MLNSLKISLRQKIILIIFGVFLSLVLLETGLRIAGFVILSRQEHRNMVSIRQRGAYRIMCLGESTTGAGAQDSYPSQLEEVLNQRQSGIRFSVINKGVVGVNTVYILAHLEDNLNRYNPDMVITMMGINDFGSHLPYEAATDSRIRLFLRTLRTYKLARLLWLHIVSKIKAIGIHRQKDLLTTKLRERSTTQTDPGNKDAREAYIDLAWRYKNRGNYTEAEALFKKALEINPRNENAYVGLGVLSEAKGNYTEAEALFKKALEINPANDSAYTALGTFLQFRQKDAEVEALLKKASELNPKNYTAPFQLGRTYVIQCRYDEAEVWFKKALAIDPQNSLAYLGLGWVYMTQKKYAQAEELFKRLIELTPENDMGYRGLVALYEEMGRFNLAKDHANKADSLKCSPIMRNNYRKLKGILDQRGVKFVCMQYPVRSVKPLKDLFKGEDGVIFVDNEKIFKDALKKGNSKDYFVDMFGGDFGHCTRKGNRIIAKNIADVILKECFHK